MAERRMFSRRIIRTDWFTSLPDKAQILYFHFCLDADDDGFVSNPVMTMRQLACSDKDLAVLIENQQLISFDSGIVLIKHWLIHNELKNDRYKPTTHTKERELVYVKDNGAYSTTTGAPLNIWRQVGSNMSPQNSIGKVSIGKRSKEEMLAHKNAFERVWSIYPKKVGKQACFAWWERKTFDEKTVEKMIASIKAYSDTKAWKGGYIPHPRTFFNQGRWEDEIPEGEKEQKQFKSYSKK